MIVEYLVSNHGNSLHVDASYQILVHLARQFQRRRFFRYRPIRNKNCLWWPCLLTDRDEMSIRHRGHSINASYQVSVNLADGFQRRRLKCEKQMTDNKRQMPSDAKNPHCLWQGELKGILKCENLHVMYSIDMLHYISIS
jgi:hypothetical protein